MIFFNCIFELDLFYIVLWKYTHTSTYTILLKCFSSISVFSSLCSRIFIVVISSWSWSSLWYLSLSTSLRALCTWRSCTDFVVDQCFFFWQNYQGTIIIYLHFGIDMLFSFPKLTFFSVRLSCVFDKFYYFLSIFFCMLEDFI